MINYQENNKADVIGFVDSPITLSHKVHGEEFYTFSLKVPRLSDNFDYINTTISQRLINENIVEGAKVKISGQFRSYNNYSPNSNRLVLTLFVYDIDLDLSDDDIIYSQIGICGYICKEPIYRKTPFGREIADILLAVNRSYNKSDYLPCIAWGRNAKFAQNLKVGQKIKLHGRIQSRTYQKKDENEQIVEKMAYEISVNKLEVVHDQAE